jgi:hypothetical protein
MTLLHEEEHTISDTGEVIIESPEVLDGIKFKNFLVTGKAPIGVIRIMVP